MFRRVGTCKAGIWGEKLGLGRERGQGQNRTADTRTFSPTSLTAGKGKGTEKGDASALGEVETATETAKRDVEKARFDSLPGAAPRGWHRKASWALGGAGCHQRHRGSDVTT
jgi:hypothetical protein